ncbi:unnamed protein product [Allacma fusca]|uniref:Uncharacterized protein n=1 Tax=Allacma fusca TaxID=39272 RepID=A0A8J2LBL1_9HEXA|nr:unnamed protein product [Allacma fusca]
MRLIVKVQLCTCFAIDWILVSIFYRHLQLFLREYHPGFLLADCALEFETGLKVGKHCSSGVEKLRRNWV